MEICQSVAKIKMEGAKNADGHGAYKWECTLFHGTMVIQMKGGTWC